MFDNLSDKLDKAFIYLKGTENNWSKRSRNFKRSSTRLLDADVNFKIAKDFTNRGKKKHLDRTF
jgi:signal recognition particle subunit SRP54